LADIFALKSIHTNKRISYIEKMAFDFPIIYAQSHDQYKLVTSAPVLLERMVQNGCTVIDGPELIWADSIKENRIKRDAEGYEIRNWSFYDQFQNDFIEL